MDTYFNPYAFKYSDMKILEMGAGISDATLPVIDTSRQHGEQEAGACTAV